MPVLPSERRPDGGVVDGAAQNRGARPLHGGDLRGRPAGGGEVRVIFDRVLQEPPAVRPHQPVRADEVRLPGLAEPLAGPRPVAGHGGVELVHGELHRQHAHDPRAVQNRRGEERRRIAAAGAVGGEVREVDAPPVRAGRRLPHDLRQARPAVGAVGQRRGEVRLLLDGVEDAAAVRGDDEEVVEPQVCFDGGEVLLELRELRGVGFRDGRAVPRQEARLQPDALRVGGQEVFGQRVAHVVAARQRRDERAEVPVLNRFPGGVVGVGDGVEGGGEPLGGPGDRGRLAQQADLVPAGVEQVRHLPPGAAAGGGEAVADRLIQGVVRPPLRGPGDRHAAHRGGNQQGQQDLRAEAEVAQSHQARRLIGGMRRAGTVGGDAGRRSLPDPAAFAQPA